jgi:hypothetical protein
MKDKLTPAIIILLLIALLACCFYTGYLLDRVSRQLLAEVKALEFLLKNGDWSGTLSLQQQLAVHWEKQKKTWSLMLEHQELENISCSLVRLKNRLLQQSLDESEMELSSLSYLINRLPQKEKLSPENFF